jgi:hypothetical protein
MNTKKSVSKGRPQHLLHTTALGEQFIEQYNRLLNLRLHINDNDIKKALRQSELTRRLIEQRINPYSRFQEVNEIARNIARTTQASENP